MKRNWRILLQPYQKALNRYLKQGGASGLQSALKLGHRAVALKLETLDLALIHEQALLDQLRAISSTAARDRIIKRARTFFAKAIIAMEATHRSALESNLQLRRLNKSLNRRTLDLDSSNRQLKKEISRRQVIEETLRKSEQHTVQLLERSRRLQDQLRLLSRRVLSVQEEERKRISRELHDVIAQMLTGINVRLASLKLEASDNAKGLSKKISRTQKLVEKSVDIVHRFARELRPALLDDLGLIPALHTLAKSFSQETSVRVHLKAFAGVEKISNSKRTALYRLAQEALSNVSRHAHATHVEILIEEIPNAARMQIKDNGRSFEVAQVFHSKRSKRLGLIGMRERIEMVGGRLSIESAPGKGTTIEAVIPSGNKRTRSK